MNFPSQIFFNDINHRYRAAILKKNSLWLLTFYMAVAAYYFGDFIVRDIKIAVYLESPRKINFNLVSEISEKKRVLTIHNKVPIYLHR